VEGLRVRAAQRRLSSRKTSQLLYEKHRILRFFLGGLRPLVLRSASCRAAFMLRDQWAEFTKNIAAALRKTSHPAIFSWRAPPAGAALGILPSST
jgi:hypothetical protein